MVGYHMVRQFSGREFLEPAAAHHDMCVLTMARRT